MKEVFEKIGKEIAAEIEVGYSTVFAVMQEGGPDELYIINTGNINGLRKKAKGVFACEDCETDCSCEAYSALHDEVEKYKRAAWGYFLKETRYF